MAENTKISWTTHTMNPFLGCTKIAPGCTNCYAEVLTTNRMGISVWGPKSRRQMTGASIWSKPKAWNRQAEADGQRVRVFCASLCDVFEEFDGPVTDAKKRQLFLSPGGTFAVREDMSPVDDHGWRPVTLDDLRRRLFSLIDATPWLDWQLLTKRPENIRKMWVSRIELQTDLDEIEYRPNVWLGTSISEQKTADENIPNLLECRGLAPVLFVSYEPALGPVDFDPVWRQGAWIEKLDWLIAGGESGPGFRPMDLDWARSARDQCRAAGVPFFFKQSAAIRPGMGVELDGEIIHEFPAPRASGKATANA